MAALPIRTSEEEGLPTVGQHEFPALFTVEGSGRHEVLLVSPGQKFAELASIIEELIRTSPNAGEFMGKYRNKEIMEKVVEIKVKWGENGRDMRLFPKETVLTEENSEAVLRMMAVGVGKDVFDVQVKRTGGEEKKKGR